MRIKNKIVNYFVEPSFSGKKPRVFLSPVTMNSEVAKALINRQLKKQNDSLSNQKLLQVCFDVDSERIYLPNANQFLPEQIRILLDAAKLTITKDYGGFSLDKPIEGSPFSFVRIRKISNFVYAYKTIKDTFKSKDIFDIPVIEANLARMPTTVKSLPQQFHNNKNYVGGYIGTNFASSIKFFDDIDLSGKERKDRTLVLEQPTPVILIDISPEVNPTASEKEWSILSGYRDFIYDNKNKTEETNDFNSFADLYAIKRYLYLGWPFEEVCYILLGSASNFGELILAIQRLYSAAKSLEKENRENPAKNPYYITFKIDPNTFPLKLSDNLSLNKQIELFQVIEYDSKTGFIIIETPVYISSDICIKILKARSKPFISRYNPAMNTIDIKSKAEVLKELQMQGTQAEKIKSLVQFDVKKMYNKKEPPQFRTDERARGISLSNPDICNLRKLSEYYYACDFIKKMCQKRGVEFFDIDIVIGPTERIFGPGVLGGFMGKKQFIESKLTIPYELVKGIFITPPIIVIDSVSMPSYAAQSDTLIHEYSHNIFNITNPEYKHKYHEDPHLKEKDKLKYWDLYLNDEDERIAHKEEIKFQLKSGVSVDEIIRNKIGGSINMQGMLTSYPIALKFRELVQEAVKELENEEEENEKPTGTTERT